MRPGIAECPVRRHATIDDVGRRRALAASVARLLLGLSLLAGIAGETWAAPRIEAERTEIDLGEMVRGEVREARFRIVNQGDELLRITRVKPG
jgi:hypothetical protein